MNEREAALAAKGWSTAANDDGLIEMRGPHEMSVFFSQAHSDIPAVYFRGYWERVYTSDIMTPLAAAWRCFEEGRHLQPKPRRYRHGLPKLEVKP